MSIRVGDRVKVTHLIDREDTLSWIVGEEGTLEHIDGSSPEYGVRFGDDDADTYFYEDELEVLA